MIHAVLSGTTTILHGAAVPVVIWFRSVACKQKRNDQRGTDPQKDFLNDLRLRQFLFVVRRTAATSRLFEISLPEPDQKRKNGEADKPAAIFGEESQLRSADA